MFVFETVTPNDPNPLYWNLVEVYEPNANGIAERTVHVKHLSLDDIGEIVIGAVSIVNPAMGEVMRGMLNTGSEER